MKYLCVCDGGNVRSAALAFVLHDELGQEAVAVGRLRVSLVTLATFCDWADTVVIMQPHMIESIPAKHRAKTRCVDVRVDRYGIYIHPELLPQVREGAKWLLSQEPKP